MTLFYQFLNYCFLIPWPFLCVAWIILDRVAENDTCVNKIWLWSDHVFMLLFNSLSFLHSMAILVQYSTTYYLIFNDWISIENIANRTISRYLDDDTGQPFRSYFMPFHTVFNVLIDKQFKVPCCILMNTSFFIGFLYFFFFVSIEADFSLTLKPI